MMHAIRSLGPCIPLAALVLLATSPGASSAGAQATDPFELLRALESGLAGSSAVTVPPRALAVIPERHTDRLLRVVDELARIEPQFDDVAGGAGLSSRVAIQLRTREANIPIFVAKNDATISTVLSLQLGARIEVIGVLVERGGRYLVLASEVRSAASGSARGR